MDQQPQQPNGLTEPIAPTVPQQPVQYSPTPSPAVSPAPQPASQDPGRTMGIASIIVGLFFGLIGLILGIVARNKSKKAGFDNTPALIGIIVSVIAMVIQAIVGTFIILGIIGIGAMAQKCQELGPGTHTVDGTTITCGENGVRATTGSRSFSE